MDTPPGGLEALETLACELELATGDAVILADAGDVVRRWSAACRRLLGLTAEQALGRKAAEVLPLPRRQVDAPGIFERLRRGERWGAAPDNDSARPKLVWTAAPLHDAQQAFRGVMYRARRPVAWEPVEPTDVSALEARGFELVPFSIAVLDRQRRLLAGNAAFKGAVRRAFNRDLATGEDLLKVAAPGTEAAFLEAFDKALGGQGTRRFRHLRYPNGTEVDHLVSYSPLPGPAAGEVEGVVLGTWAFEESQAPAQVQLGLLQRALAVAPFAVLVADTQAPDLPIRFASPAIEKLTGWKPEEVVGRNARLFQGRFRDQPGLAVVRRALSEGTACDVVLWNERKDGSSFLNRLALTPVRDDLGVLSHYIGIQEDVSQREELTQRLRNADASELSQRMLAGAVHDLRNMLTVVSAQVGLSRRDVGFQPEVARHLDEAGEALQQAAALTRLLLSPVSRSRAGLSATELRDVLRTVQSVARYVLPAATALQVELPESQAWVPLERGALEQVLLNLLLNASEAMPQGGHISLQGTRQGDCWEVRVTDDGPGMEEAVRARLFEPYFTTKAQGQGTGLGLSTCAQLVQAAGGELSAVSAPGAGATFTIRLPAVEAQEGHRPLDEASPLPGLSGQEVLVVEPDTSVRASLCALLLRARAEVRAAGDVEVAREQASGLGESAVLVVDFSDRLPGAYRLASQWLQVDRSRRVLVLGNLSPFQGEPRARQLVKPFQPREFLQALSELRPAEGTAAQA